MPYPEPSVPWALQSTKQASESHHQATTEQGQIPASGGLLRPGGIWPEHSGFSHSSISKGYGEGCKVRVGSHR